MSNILNESCLAKGHDSFGQRVIEQVSISYCSSVSHPKPIPYRAFIPDQTDTYSVDFQIIITHSPGNLQCHRYIIVRALIIGDVQCICSHRWDTNLGLEHVRVTDMDELPLDPIQDVWTGYLLSVAETALMVGLCTDCDSRSSLGAFVEQRKLGNLIRKLRPKHLRHWCMSGKGRMARFR
jgi:hypothetical protein